MNSDINFSVDGLAKVPVIKTTCLPAVFAAVKLAFTLVSTSVQVAALLAIFGFFNLILSYNDNIEA